MDCRIILSIMVASLAATVSHAQVGMINESFQPGGDPQIVLNYPVPQPVESASAGAYFRTYNGLRVRWTDLELSHAFIEEVNLGNTRAGRDIYGYIFGDADDVAVDGTREPGVLVDGTIHAREWVSPEILTQLGEYLADGYGSDPIASYLVDQNRTVLIPVLNVDGFLQTQRFFNQYYQSGAGQRDGRLRRKNMLSVDEALTTTADNLLGVDLNRNFPLGWNNGTGSSSSQFYRGGSSLSEPEAQCLESAGESFNAGQLRCYVDIHGAIPAIYYINTNTASVDAVTEQLALRMRDTFRFHNPISSAYPGIALFPIDQEGISDEYFGNTYQIPAFTIEYTTPKYRDGVTIPPNPFINPDDEVGFIVEENLSAVLLAMLFASGPPILEEIIIWHDADAGGDIDGGEIAYHAKWLPTGPPPATARQLDTIQDTQLIFGRTYQVLLRFNKPMRRFVSGAPANWPGLNFSLQPQVAIDINNGVSSASLGTLPADDGWQSASGTSTVPGYGRYAGDSWLGTLDLTALPDAPPQSSPLRVAVADLYGHALDAMPATVSDWSAGWTDFEDAEGNGSQGGENASFVLSFTQSTGIQRWEIHGFD